MKTDAEVRLYMKERSQGPDPGAGRRQGGDERAHGPHVRAAGAAAQPAEAAARLPDAPEPVRRRLAVGRRAARARPGPAGQDAVRPAGRARARAATRPVQLRTFQRHVATWRLAHGPEQEVIFPQVHRPGVVARSPTSPTWPTWASPSAACRSRTCSSTWCFVYSNVEAVRVCFAESFEALVEGLEAALWQLGRRAAPAPHRPPRRGHPAARRRRPGPGARALRRGACATTGWSRRSTTPAWRTRTATSSRRTTASRRRSTRRCGCAAAATSATGPPTSASCQELVAPAQRHARRRAGPRSRRRCARCRRTPLAPCREVRGPVSRFSTIQVLRNTYSVPVAAHRRDACWCGCGPRRWRSTAARPSC